MKTYHKQPQNRDFFQSYYPLTPTLRLLGLMAQIISALTEIGVIYTLIHSALAEVFPAEAPLIALIFALTGTLFLEAGLRRFLPYAFRAVLYRRYRGLHLAITLSVFAIALSLLCTSGYLSVQGSRSIVRQVVPPPLTATDPGIASRAALERSEALQQWALDSALIAQPLAQRRQDVQAAFRARMQAGGESHSQLRAQEASALSALEVERSAALGRALEARNRRVQEALNRQQVAEARLDSVNAAAAFRAEHQITRYGGGLASFTIMALFVLVFCIAIEEVLRKGSGMEEVVVPGPAAFKPGIWPELVFAVEARVDAGIRRHIRRLALPDQVVLQALKPDKPLSGGVNGQHAPKLVARAPCEVCGTPIQPKTVKHRFCSDACRLKHHEVKHGKRFLPRKVYRAQMAEQNGRKPRFDLFGDS